MVAAVPNSSKTPAGRPLYVPVQRRMTIAEIQTIKGPEAGDHAAEKEGKGGPNTDGLKVVIAEGI